jgi:hypothetical protein
MSDEIDIDSTVDALAGDLGLNGGESGVDSSSATDTPAADPEPARDVPPPAPKSWSKEAQAVFNTLPEIARKEIFKREEDALSGITKYKGGSDWADKVRGVFQPYAATIQSLGVDEATAIQQLLSADHTLRHGTPAQRLDFVRSMISSFQIDPKGLMGEEAPYVDPALKPVLDKVSALEGTLAGIRQERFNAVRETVGKEVEAFATDVAAHPYFEELGDDITKLINAGYSLPESYEKAVWANPVTRSKELAKQTQTSEERIRKEIAAAAKGARKGVAANVRASPKEKDSISPLGSMEDTLAETLGEIRDRVH